MPESDYLLDAVYEHWDHIWHTYQQFEEKKPLVLFDIQEHRIYVYPYKEFRNDLSPKSQVSLADQYVKAAEEKKILVFVRDNEQRRVSILGISLPLPKRI